MTNEEHLINAFNLKPGFCIKCQAAIPEDLTYCFCHADEDELINYLIKDREAKGVD